MGGYHAMGLGWRERERAAVLQVVFHQMEGAIATRGRPRTFDIAVDARDAQAMAARQR